MRAAESPEEGLARRQANSQKKRSYACCRKSRRRIGAPPELILKETQLCVLQKVLKKDWRAAKANSQRNATMRAAESPEEGLARRQAKSSKKRN
jgi:hypothetical protein